jgi:aspartate racemase
MKKIGIVGGIGWRPTVDYYSEICRRSEELELSRKTSGIPQIPEMAIESLDLRKAAALLGDDADEGSWREFDDYHRVALRRLQNSGADFALIGSNTGHHRFQAITHGIGIPVISIIDAAAEECKRMGARQIVILGTGLTMRSAAFRDGFGRHEVEVLPAVGGRIRETTLALIAELQRGRDNDAPRKLQEIAESALGGHSGRQAAVCLACTELPLAFPENKLDASFEHEGVRYINTTAAHINMACELALG